MGYRALQLYSSRYGSTALQLYTLYTLHPSTPILWRDAHAAEIRLMKLEYAMLRRAI